MTIRTAPAPLPDVRKIAVLRANGLGDFLFALPALESLRTVYPDAEIVLLGKEWHVEALSGRPMPFDRVLAVPPSRGVNGGECLEEDHAELARFFSAVQDEQFDLAFQLHGGGKHSNPFVRRLGARLTIGLKAADAPPLDRWVPYIYFQSEVIRYLEVVGLAGAAPVTLAPRLKVTSTDLAESHRVVAPGSRPLVALHPGATDPRRRWPPEKFAAVADALTADGAEIVVVGGPSDEQAAAAVTAAMRAPGHNAAGRLSFAALVGLLRRSALVVANDSGPLHLAGAVSTPTVGIYQCFNALTACTPLRARHRPVVSWRLDCPVCGYNSANGRCDHTASFVADIPVSAVLDEARALFAQRERRSEPAA